MPDALRTTVMFCGQSERKGEPQFVDFYPNTFCVKMHGHKRFFKVQVAEDPTREIRHVDAKENDGYWGWWETADHLGRSIPKDQERFVFVYPHQMLLRMCFPYGPEAEEKRGRGLMLPVTIELLEEVPE